MRFVLVLALVLVAGAASADGTHKKTGRTTEVARADGAPLNGAAIASALVGRVVAYSDGSTQSFNSGGDTVFHNGKDTAGRWQVQGDRYCSVWPPSQLMACYVVTRTGSDIAFVASDGSITAGRLAR